MIRRAPQLCLAISLCLMGACGEAEAAGPPNIILIVVDTLRADVLISRRELVDTPNIDALGADGVAFVSAFAHAPMTLPSHTSLFSSRLPLETGVLNNGMEVPEDLPLLAEHLAGLGYETRAVISLGALWGPVPGKTLERGFQSYELVPGQVVPAPEMLAAMTRTLEEVDTDRPLFFFGHFSDPHEPHNLYSVDAAQGEATLSLDGAELESVTTSVASYWTRTFELSPGNHRFAVRSAGDTTIRSLQVEVDGSEVPLEVNDADTGEPLKLSPGMRTRHATCDFEIAPGGTRAVRITAWITDCPSPEEGYVRYLGEVEFVDRYVGELVAELKRRGLYDRSIVVFTSDHGESLGYHGGGGHVETLFDELTHVPLIVKPALGIGKEALALRSRDVVRHLDLVPTLLQMAGLPPLPGQRGSSLLAGGQGPAVSETHRPQARESQIAIRTGTLKLIYYIEQDRFELYDLTSDPGELEDVFAQRGDEVLDWQAELRVMAERAQGAALRLEDLGAEELERMQALGYFGDD